MSTQYLPFLQWYNTAYISPVWKPLHSSHLQFSNEILSHCFSILWPCSCLILVKALIDILIQLILFLRVFLHSVKILLNSNFSFQSSLQGVTYTICKQGLNCTPSFSLGKMLSILGPGVLVQLSFFWHKLLRTSLKVRLCHWFYTYPWVITSPCFPRLPKSVLQALMSQILLKVKIYGIYCLSPMPKAHYLSHKEIKLAWHNFFLTTQQGMLLISSYLSF